MCVRAFCACVRNFFIMDKKKFLFCLDLIEQDIAQAMCCGIDEFLQHKLSDIFCKIETLRLSFDDVSK